MKHLIKYMAALHANANESTKVSLDEVRMIVRKILEEDLASEMIEYKKWKKNNVMIRGISSDSTLDVSNGSGARFGTGLYMAPLSNKVMAKQYGTVYFVVNGKPKNPKIFKDANLAEIWLQQNLIFNKYKTSREFEEHTSIQAEMLKLGYDGLEIKGRETVNYTPENVKYYSNENQLIQHYEHYVENKSKDNINEVRNFVRNTLLVLNENKTDKQYHFYLMCDKLCNIEGVDVKNKMIADATQVSRKEFINNCAFAKELFEYEGQMADDPSHGFYKSNVKGVPCYYMQYAGFEFIFLKDYPSGKEYWIEDLNESIGSGKGYRVVDKQEFKDALLDLATLDLEDSQVRYPNVEGKKTNFLFGGNKYYLSILNKTALPSSGPFELIIENDDDQIIGFIRGTKAGNIISFNLIHIQDDSRGLGIGTDIYEKFLNKGFIIKSDSEITDVTYSMYDRLVIYGYKPLVFDDMTVGLLKSAKEDNIQPLTEDYPSSFNIETFKSLKSFKDRVAYCDANLKKIGTGSSRIVYKIDDTKVLKLAKNKKGIAQNDIEIDRGNHTYFSNILAQVFDSDENGLWVEMELAEPINKYEFRRLTDFDIKDVSNYLIDFQQTNNGKKSHYHASKELNDRLDNDEFIQSLIEFIAGTDALAGDFGQATSYGLVRRDGGKELVLIDFGITEDIHKKYYRESVSVNEEEKSSNINDNFQKWFAGSKVVEANGNPLVVHHGTAKKFSKFNFKNAAQQIIWFTSNKGAVEAGEVGAAGKGHVMDLYVSMKNPAGWDEYQKYRLGQLERLGYDGAILPDPDGTFTGFVFEPSQIKSIANKGEWNPGSGNIFKEDLEGGKKN